MMSDEPVRPTLSGPDLERLRARQRSRNRAMGIVLGALVVLFFAITIVKIAKQNEHRPPVAPLSPIKQS